MLFLLLLITQLLFAGENTGVVDNADYIAGNGFSWDYLLLFNVENKNKVYRAITEVENTINNNDQLVKIGAMKRCVMATIFTHKSRSELLSRYSTASSYADLANVMNYKKWDGQFASDIAFNKIDIMDICGGSKKVVRHQEDRQNEKDVCQAPGSPSSFLSFGITKTIELTSNQEEYWYCLRLPYTGFNIKANTSNISISLLDLKMNRITEINGDLYAGGQNKHYGGPSGYWYTLKKGRYYIRIDNRNRRNGKLTLTLKRNEGSN
jgi:hypothetical protein